MWESLGLEQCDEVVYRHYIARPGSTAGEVSCATGLQESIVNSSRARLIDLGLLRLEPPGDVRPVPNGLATVTEMFRNDLDAEYARKRSELAQMESVLTRLTNDQILGGPNAGEPQVDRVPSLDAMAVRIAELMCHARTEVAWVDPSSSISWKARTDLTVPSEVNAAQRGVDVRVICPPPRMSDASRHRWMDSRRNSPVRTRVMSTSHMELLIFDRRIAILADYRSNSDQNALLVREALLVYVLHRVFEMWWVQATDLGSFADADEPAMCEVNGEERVILRMLSDGDKDETVAKKLGISVRTVRRKVSDVMRRMPADSRFQAGVRAAHQGWLLGN
jgi:DNA-binding NarL/FixJ family response regulator